MLTGHYSPLQLLRSWVSPGGPRETFDIWRTSRRPSPPPPPGSWGTRPPSSSPRGRVPCAGDTCVGSMTPSIIRLFPNILDHHWKQERTFLQLDEAFPFCRNLELSWTTGDVGRKSIRSLSENNHHKVPWWRHGWSSPSVCPASCAGAALKSSRAPRASRRPRWGSLACWGSWTGGWGRARGAERWASRPETSPGPRPPHLECSAAISLLRDLQLFQIYSHSLAHIHRDLHDQCMGLLSTIARYNQRNDHSVVFSFEK